MSARPIHVLIVDDDAQIRRLLRIGLVGQGYDCIEAETAAEALAVCAKEHPDIVILDLGLPDQDGTSVIGTVRQNSLVPIVVLSAEESVERKQIALDLGADDYVTKPFGMDELVARIRAALRRTEGGEVAAPIVRTESFEVDLAAKRATRAGQPVRLTPTEWHLVEALLRRPGTLVPSSQLLAEVWGPGYAKETNYLRVYFAGLRRKLESDPAHPQHFITEPGVGYRFEA